MTKENKLHIGDAWFNPSNPEKLVVFKKPKLTSKQKNMLEIAKYIVRFDGIKKRINELEQEND